CARDVAGSGLDYW
nr:immunoglobulin heavy chain junction region [Macaca mulatta]